MIDPEKFFESSIQSHINYLKHLKNVNKLVCVLLTYKDEIGLHMYSIQTNDQSPINAIKPIVYKTKPDFYIVFAEAFMILNTDLEQSVSTLRHGDIEKMDKRKEILNCYGTSKDGKHKVNRTFIIKRKNNRVDDLIEIKGTVVSGKLP